MENQLIPTAKLPKLTDELRNISVFARRMTQIETAYLNNRISLMTATEMVNKLEVWGQGWMNLLCKDEYNEKLVADTRAKLSLAAGNTRLFYIIEAFKLGGEDKIILMTLSKSYEEMPLQENSNGHKNIAEKIYFLYTNKYPEPGAYASYLQENEKNLYETNQTMKTIKTTKQPKTKQGESNRFITKENLEYAQYIIDHIEEKD